MIYNSAKKDRRPIRVKGYDYSQAGAYFITMCSQNKECIFGQMVEDNIELRPIGKIAFKYWFQIPNHFQNVELDEFVIMPNHIHGIIILTGVVGAQYIEPLHIEPIQNKYQHIIPKSVGSIIRSYKSAITRWCHINSYEHFKWQRNYYEHIIRDEDDLNQIREYILNNPTKWDLDIEKPENIGGLSC